jgi:iron complex outermembrane receptor protein
MVRTIIYIGMVSVLLAGVDARLARAAEAPTANDALAEITVTAEKQTQSLQKTAAEVTALPADILIDAGITDLRQAQMIVPSVRFQAEGNNTQVFVRGVGANLDFPNVEPNVAFNFAGVHLPREASERGVLRCAPARDPAGIAGHPLRP